MLVAVDGGEASQRAVAFVNRFFEGMPVEIVGLNVANEPITWMPVGVGVGAAFSWPFGVAEGSTLPDSAAAAAAGAAQRRGDETLADSGLRCERREVRFGDPVDVITRVAADEHVDLVVVGSADKGLLARLLSGSVTLRLARHPAVPVLIVP